MSGILKLTVPEGLAGQTRALLVLSSAKRLAKVYGLRLKIFTGPFDLEFEEGDLIGQLLRSAIENNVEHLKAKWQRLRWTEPL